MNYLIALFIQLLCRGSYKNFIKFEVRKDSSLPKQKNCNLGFVKENIDIYSFTEQMQIFIYNQLKDKK
jgi:hypothetical protein